MLISYITSAGVKIINNIERRVQILAGSLCVHFGPLTLGHACSHVFLNSGLKRRSDWTLVWQSQGEKNNREDIEKIAAILTHQKTNHRE